MPMRRAAPLLAPGDGESNLNNNNRTNSDNKRQEVDDSDFYRPSDIPSCLGGCETQANC